MSYDAPPPPPPGYGQPSPYGAPVPQGTSSKAVWSLVLGILGILCCGFITGIPALLLGRSAQREIAQTGQGGAGMAKAGFILGIIAIVFTVIQVILFATGVLDFNSSFSTTG
ncbi:MAG: DUF4190 domain-containing protein [Nocardioides sp.]